MKYESVFLVLVTYFSYFKFFVNDIHLILIILKYV